ncbi:MAG: hypothetical protein L0Z62_38990 [Gemmataceae bacterium]|nr:hypothetical protein [Gemmataceae bacterium]
MIDAQTYNRLQDLIRREGRSLLQYAVESFPWTNSSSVDVNARLQEMAAAETEATAALNRLLLRHRLTPPWLGPYPMPFTSYNFLALERLLPLLIEHQRTGVARVEADLKQITDSAARAAVQHLLEVIRRNLSELEALRPASAAATS